MKILQVSHNYHVVGGSDSVFFATCDLLRSAGHQVVPFCINSPNNRPTKWSQYFPSAANTGAKPLRDGVQYFYNANAKNHLNRLLDDAGDIDVAHLHIYHGKQTPAILPVLRARGIPVVQTLHEYKLACPVYTMQRRGLPCDLCVQGSNLNCVKHRCKDGSLLRSLVMTAEHGTSRLLGDVRLMDRFLCVSDFQRAVMARAGIPGEKLYTLHNFVTGIERPKTGHDGYFLYFGRVEKLKGLETLVDAFKRCGQRLLIAGDGNWRRELEAAIAETPTIEYLGFQSGDALTRLIARAQTVVVPSEWNENCPMSVLEAKNLGRPVIGANIGGIPELVRDGIDGALFEPGDVEGLIRAVKSIRIDSHGEMSLNALQDAAERFSEAVHLQSLMAHYRDVIASPRLARTA